MIVFIDRQHSGKPNKIHDRGAGRDLDNDGNLSADEMESIWTARLSIQLEIALLDMGIQVMPLSDGIYKHRHERVNKYAELHPGPWIYLAMHLNAGGGNYSAMFHDHRSAQGQQLATSMATQIKTDHACIESGKAIKATSTDWTKNAYYTIRGVGKPIAICCEPFFMDTHAELLSIKGMGSIATSMAKALNKWKKDHS
tara:strand:+ start:520 stop:1113 length:594 start_codon:yes stop_codon:yes gene_type:complete